MIKTIYSILAVIYYASGEGGVGGGGSEGGNFIYIAVVLFEQ